MKEYSRTEITYGINEWVHNEKHRRILYRRLIDGLTYEALAEEFDMSVRQIKNIVYRAQEKVFRHL